MKGDNRPKEVLIDLQFQNDREQMSRRKNKHIIMIGLCLGCRLEASQNWPQPTKTDPSRGFPKTVSNTSAPGRGMRDMTKA
jgi:hypothetical protein